MGIFRFLCRISIWSKYFEELRQYGNTFLKTNCNIISMVLTISTVLFLYKKNYLAKANTHKLLEKKAKRKFLAHQYNSVVVEMRDSFNKLSLEKFTEIFFFKQMLERFESAIIFSVFSQNFCVKGCKQVCILVITLSIAPK